MAEPISLPNLREILDPAIPVFLLIDPLLGEPVICERPSGNVALSDVAAARMQAWGRHIQPIPLDSRIPLQAAFHPYLVELKGPGDDWISDSMELAADEWRSACAGGLSCNGTAAHRIGGWLQSSLHAAELAEAMAPLFRVRTDAVTKASYLRLADRRVFDWIRYVMGDDGLAKSLGGRIVWHYLDSYARLRTLQGAQGMAQALMFNREQWAQVMQGDVHHLTNARWVGELVNASIPLPQSPTHEALWLDVSRAVKSAARAAACWPALFESIHDHTGWAALHLLHSSLERDARVSALMGQAESHAPEPQTMHTFSGVMHARLTEGTAQ